MHGDWPPLIVSVDELACLDCMVWLRSGAAAAQRLGFSQPTISRSVKRVADVFDIRPAKPDGEWELQGDAEILNLERLVHQQYRWCKGLPLRMEAQYFSGPLYCDYLPDGWIRGNFDFVEVHTPSQHLRNGVIDAWIGSYPDVPDEDGSDLFCVHLTRLPVRLVVAANHPLVGLGDRVTLEDVK